MAGKREGFTGGVPGTIGRICRSLVVGLRKKERFRLPAQLSVYVIEALIIPFTEVGKMVGGACRFSEKWKLVLF